MATSRRKAKVPAEMDMSRVIAVVLGGGRGARLHPLTALRAKPAVPLFGRYRLVDVPLSNCIHSDVRRIFVLTQYNSASLNRHVNTTYRFDLFSLGFVEILAAEQTSESGDWYQGTADAVRKQLRHLKGVDCSHYLILSGDQLYRMDYRNLMRTHLTHDADVTVAVLPIGPAEAHRYGILQTMRTGRIHRFVEKPASKEVLAPLATPGSVLAKAGLAPSADTYLASMGVYLFRKETLEHILEEHLDRIDFGKDILPGILKEHRVYAHLFTGFWEDIGTVRSYYHVHMQMVAPNPPFRFFDPGHVIYTHPRYLPGTRLYDATVKTSIVCEGCRIHRARIVNSVIGVRSTISFGTRIERSVLMGADFFEAPGERREFVSVGIGKNAVISGAIIDKNARIGDNVVIRGSRKLRDCDGDGYAVRDGIVVVLKNATIPPGTRIG